MLILKGMIANLKKNGFDVEDFLEQGFYNTSKQFKSAQILFLIGFFITHFFGALKQKELDSIVTVLFGFGLIFLKTLFTPLFLVLCILDIAIFLIYFNLRRPKSQIFNLFPPEFFYFVCSTPLCIAWISRVTKNLKILGFFFFFFPIVIFFLVYVVYLVYFSWTTLQISSGVDDKTIKPKDDDNSQFQIHNRKDITEKDNNTVHTCFFNGKQQEV